MKPDASIYKHQFVEQNILSPKAREVASEFLIEKDLEAIALGRYDLSDGVYVNIDEYTPHLLFTEKFLVLFPIDGHKPWMKVDANEQVRKVVAKVLCVNV